MFQHAECYALTSGSYKIATSIDKAPTQNVDISSAELQIKFLSSVGDVWNEWYEIQMIHGGRTWRMWRTRENLDIVLNHFLTEGHITEIPDIPSMKWYHMLFYSSAREMRRCHLQSFFRDTLRRQASLQFDRILQLFMWEPLGLPMSTVVESDEEGGEFADFRRRGYSKTGDDLDMLCDRMTSSTVCSIESVDDCSSGFEKSFDV